MATLQFSEGGSCPPKPLYRAKQLLPNIVDGMATARPEALYAETPSSYTSYDQGYRKITYRELANAVNGIAWLLTKELGRGQDFETLAYVGPNDLSYPVIILGAVKAGYKILSVLPRNTVKDHVSLFESTRCKTLLTVEPPLSPPAVATIQQALSPRTLYVPTLFQLLDGRYEHYPYEKSFEAAKDEPLMVVHTSGTTSNPKPIVYTHDFAASYTRWIQAEPPAGFENAVSLVQSNRFFVTLPFFHAGCLYAALFDAITSQTTIITPLTGVPPSSSVIIEGLKRVQCDALLLAPPFMEQIAKNHEMLNLVCTKVRYVAYGGGDVSQACGDAFASHLTLFNFNGSTETSTYPALIRPLNPDNTKKNPRTNSDWKYIYPHPTSGLVFRPSVDKLFEAYIVRNPDPVDTQPVFKLFPHLTEYPTRDLWSRHPDPASAGAWLYRGRADDILVFKTGYLCNPITLEQALGDHPEVSAALMVGTDHYRTALLVEPNDGQWLVDKEAKENLIERIWPALQAANEAYPVSARVLRSHVLVVGVLQRAGKGTVQRGPSLKKYETEIDHLYAELGDELSDAAYQ